MFLQWLFALMLLIFYIAFILSDDSYHKLSEQEIQLELNRLQGWTIVNGKLNRGFEFNSFVVMSILLIQQAKFVALLAFKF